MSFSYFIGEYHHFRTSSVYLFLRVCVGGDGFKPLYCIYFFSSFFFFLFVLVSLS